MSKLASWFGAKRERVGAGLRYADEQPHATAAIGPPDEGAAAQWHFVVPFAGGIAIAIAALVLLAAGKTAMALVVIVAIF